MTSEDLKFDRVIRRILQRARNKSLTNEGLNHSEKDELESFYPDIYIENNDKERLDEIRDAVFAFEYLFKNNEIIDNLTEEENKNDCR